MNSLNSEKPSDFIWARFTALEAFYRDHEKYDEKDHKRVIDEIDEKVSVVYEALPKNTLFMVITGQGNAAELRRLSARRQEFHKSQESNMEEKEKSEAEGLNSNPSLSFSTLNQAHFSSSPNSKLTTELEEHKDEKSWTNEDEMALENALKVARNGLGFFVIK